MSAAFPSLTVRFFARQTSSTRSGWPSASALQSPSLLSSRLFIGTNTKRRVEMSKQKKRPDVLVRNEGTVFAFCPLTKEAKQWVEENVQLEPWQWLGNTFCVEHRYALGLGQGMKDAGLILA